MCWYLRRIFFFIEHYTENIESDIDPDMIVVEMEKICVMFER